MKKRRAARGDGLRKKLIVGLKSLAENPRENSDSKGLRPVVLTTNNFDLLFICGFYTFPNSLLDF